jgi:hypothetical protein
MMFRRALLIVAMTAAGATLVTSSLFAKQGVVQTRTGQVYDGEVDDRAGADVVTVTVRGIATQIPRADVQSITYGRGLDAEYKERLAKLDAKDFKGRMDLARWAFSQKRYDLARDAADKALAIDPNSSEATNFLTLVQSQQRMERGRELAATNPSATEPRDRAATTRGAQPDWALLSDLDINRIRQEELRNGDVRVRFQFRNDVERRFLAANRDFTFVDWRAMTPLQRAINILDRGDPQLRDDVVLASEPVAVQEYRRLIQPLVQGSCATAACHGGMSAGPLVLNTSADVNDAAAYTNFYILNQYALSQRAAGDQQGVFGGGAIERRMIDRTRAEDSLLLQYGLPRNLARAPHPDVQGFRPAYPRGREDTKYQAVARWIGTTLAPVNPNYGIDYRPPVGKRAGDDATRPASAPASNPIRRR